MVTNKSWPYGAAGLVLVLYALGHTLGAMLFTPHFSPAADGVRSSMEAVAFPCNGRSCTWFGFYLGFGYTVSLYLVFAAIYAFVLATKPLDIRQALRGLTAMLALTFVGLAILSQLYFFVQPLVLAIAVAVLLGVGVVRDGASRRSLT